ncbi:hypothetical protein ACJZ2D_002056 [Fusarium nematophilum]
MSGYEHIITLPRFTEAQAKSPDHAREIVAQWIETFQKVLKSGTVDDLASLFHDGGWIRDFLAFSWDFRTIQGSTDLAAYIKHQDAPHLLSIQHRNHGAFQPVFKTPAPDVHWVESMFDFETSVGTGKGMLRLVSDDSSVWKGYAINFTLQELKGFEEQSGTRRPHGYVDPRGGTWGERRERQKEFLDEDPAVFVIGAGQAGIEIAARLRHVGLPTLVVDKNAQVGDNWRKRYRTLMTHDPIQYCHLPFIPFPPDWPMYVPKDKLADWLESYAHIMELNVWTGTTVEKADYDDKNKIWTVTVRRGDGSERTIKPRHVVFATGQSGDPIIPSFPGTEDFKGVVYHGSQHTDASHFTALDQKKVVVVGSGNSSHDICQNFYENGAGQVTMLQRGGTYVISVDKGVPIQHKGLYGEDAPPIEDADVYGQSLPVPVQFALNVSQAERIAVVDKASLDGLTKAGFLLDSGPDKSGIFRKYITRGGGYYIDVGCSQLIVDGKIKVRQSPGGIKNFAPDGLVLADGSKLEADIVVLATGYDGMRSAARNVLGDKVADRVGDIWDLDEQGEIRSIWRSSGHPQFWFMGGNLALCRSYSRLLALQIKAVEEGLFKQTHPLCFHIHIPLHRIPLIPVPKQGPSKAQVMSGSLHEAEGDVSRVDSARFAVIGNARLALFVARTDSAVNMSSGRELLGCGRDMSLSWSNGSVGMQTCYFLGITDYCCLVGLEQEFHMFKADVKQHMAVTASSQQPKSPQPYSTDRRPSEPSLGSPIPSQPLLRPSRETYTDYCHIWFDRCHSYFPILHQPTTLSLCENDSQPGTPASLILDAIAVVMFSTRQAQLDNGSDPEPFIRQVTDEIILASISHLSFQKLQALLLVTLTEYGNGRMTEFWNLISLCKRISTQLGLRDLVAYNCMNFGFPSVLPPRMLQIPSTAVEREEKIRAFWAIDALDSAGTLGVAWHLSVSRPEPAANLPCDEEIWRFPESVMTMYQFGSSEAPSSFSLYVRLVTNELWHVHNFLHQSCEPFSIQSMSQRQEECNAVYQRLKTWQNDFEQLLTVHSPLYTDLLSHSGTPTQQPNSILIHCTIHSAIISLHQRLIFPITISEDDPTHWEAAAERCLSSCDQMANVIRAADDDTLGIINPHVIYCVFIAARFYLIYSKAMELPLPNKLYLFIYALRVCGQIWPLARLLHGVLEAAAAEHAGTQLARPRLPVEFFDLQYFSLDIHAALRAWAEEKLSS